MITNLQNPRVKNIVKLQKKPSERKSQNTFVIEGKRELSLAQQSRFDIREIYLCDDIYKEDSSYPVNIESVSVIHISTEVYNKIAYRENSEGIIGLANNKETALKDINLSSNPLLLVLETVEKPGNLGAVLRTADAAGVDAVIVCDIKTDLYNPNVIRSSLGCIFSNQIIICDSKELIKWLTKKQIAVFAAMPGSKTPYFKIDYTKPSAFVFGAEAEGLSQQWSEAPIQKIEIPMAGKIDSLNVSVSVAIVTYEALRQREASPL